MLIKKMKSFLSASPEVGVFVITFTVYTGDEDFLSGESQQEKLGPAD